MAKTFIQYSTLDVNLEVDRSSNISSDLSVILAFPPSIPFGSEAVITITNYEPMYKYTVSVEHGTVRIEDDLIYYKAPSFLPASGSDTLSVNVRAIPVKISYFPSVDGEEKDYYYDESGKVFYVQDVIDDEETEEDFREYLERLRKNYDQFFEEAGVGAPVIRLPHFDYSDNVMEGADFHIEEMFAEYRHLERSFKDEPAPNGGIEQYFLPSNISLKPNVLPNLFDLKTTGERTYTFGFKGRNTNEDEATGNVLTGYRYPGAIGSSLVIVNNGDNNDATFIFEIPLDLHDLTAIVPPEILSLCITSLIIQPVLIGLEEGHTFLWEQISGETGSVEWLSQPGDVDLVVNLGKIKTDRVFRFWISKGTKYERFYDVVVYGTPKDEIVGSPSAENHFSVMGTNLGLGRHETRPILLTAERLWIKEFRLKYIDKIR